MGWKDVFTYVRGIAGSKGVPVAGERVDSGVPMGARIGSLVQLQRTPVIRAQAAGSLIAMPAEGDTRVLAISQIRLEPDAALYRMYLVKGDEAADEKFFQVFSADNGEVAEILYCTQLARIVPETAEDQDAYTGAGGAGLGDASYTLWREQLADMLGEAELASVFGEADRIDYTRDVGDTQAAYVPPFTGKETRIDDAEGVRGLQQEIYFMPYVRELPGGGREYLLITTEIVLSVDGDSTRRGIHVDFVIGIPIEPERIAFQ
ncbi:MAG: DUF2491 family protein [Gammaproteobacteria bacterium]